MKKRRQKSGGEVPEWVVTYGDMMSLLLCFFILLVSFSELKQPREFRKIIEKIREALGFQGGMGQVDIPETATNSTISHLQEVAKHGERQQFINRQNEDNVVGRHERVSIVHEGNWHAIGGTLPFEPGSASLSNDVQTKLREDIAPRIRDRRQIVRVIGHAWGFKDTTGGSYLEVSFRRGLAVYDFLVRECGVDPKTLRVVVAGDAEPMAVSSGQGDQTAQNRRVQVYLTDRTIDQVHPDPDGTGRAP